MNRPTGYKTINLPNGVLIRLENGNIIFVDKNGYAAEHSEFAYLVNPAEDVKRAYQELEIIEPDKSKGTDES